MGTLTPNSDLIMLYSQTESKYGSTTMGNMISKLMQPGTGINFSTSAGVITVNLDATVVAPSSRQIGTTGLLTGGGDLTANRTFDVPAADDATALAGTAVNSAVTPASLIYTLDNYLRLWDNVGNGSLPVMTV